MKNSNAIAALLGVLIVGGGIAYVLASDKSSDSKPSSDPRKIYTMQIGGGGDAGLWQFTIAQPAPDTGLEANIYGPEGPFKDEQAARTAGENWLAEHPLV